MDYQLLNRRTRETHPLDPRRTLIGTASYADVRTREGGPLLAALAVEYPDGWAVHGLSDDPHVLYNREPFGLGRQITPRPGDKLRVGDDKFRFVADEDAPPDPADAADAPTCLVYIRDPGGMEECRVVDHDLLFGRLPVCHVRFTDTKLSRLAALLAAHGGRWYAHSLSKTPVVRNGDPVHDFTPIGDGDSLEVGPLTVRVEIRPPTAEVPAPSDVPEELAKGAAVPPELIAVHAVGLRLDQWLKAHRTGPAESSGAGGWLGAPRDWLNRFWYDTPEVSAARGLRAAGKPADALAVLDRAIRNRPDSPELLRELYRLYDAVGLPDLCYRPLRQIEKLTAARGKPDAWVLEALARVCERLGPSSRDMFDRAVEYWNKLEATTGVSRARERAATMANRTLREGGFIGADSGA